LSFSTKELGRTVCRDCGVQLHSDNCYARFLERGQRVCRNCSLRHSKEYYARHKDERRLYAREYATRNRDERKRYRREYYLRTRKKQLLHSHQYWQKVRADPLRHEEYLGRVRERYRNRILRSPRLGTVLALGKRRYPENSQCEVCGLESKRLAYHHWDDKDFRKGLWLCYPCHKMAECYDKGRSVVYGRLKSSLDDKPNFTVV